MANCLDANERPRHCDVCVSMATPSDLWAERPDFWFTDIAESRTLRVIDRIASGSFGSVYLARENIDGTTVAVKRSKIQDAKEEPQAEALREVRALSHMRGCVRVVQLRSFEFGRWIVQELMPMTLRTFMSRHAKLPTPHASDGGLAHRTVQWLILSLCEAVRACHSQNLIHRDIKPENILIDASQSTDMPVLKIADLGMAKIVSERTSLPLTPLVVTIFYRAPELLSGTNRYYGKPIDVWSVGCVAHEIITGRVLFPAYDEIALRKMHAITPYGNMDRIYVPFFEHTLQMDPAQRSSIEVVVESVHVLSNNAFRDDHA